MQNEKNESFEDTLKDILTPNDPHMPQHHSQMKGNGANQKENNKEKSEEKKKPEPPHVTSSKVPPWVEIVVRIVATLLGAALLMLFAMQIAKR